MLKENLLGSDLQYAITSSNVSFSPVVSNGYLVLICAHFGPCNISKDLP